MNKYQGGEKSGQIHILNVQVRVTNFDENKALVDVILSNGLIDIRFAPFPGTAMSSKKNAEVRAEVDRRAGKRRQSGIIFKNNKITREI